MKNSTLVRFLSSLVVGGTFIGLGWFLGPKAVIWAAVVMVFISQVEFTSLVISGDRELLQKPILTFLCFATFYVSLAVPQYTILAITASALLLISSFLLINKENPVDIILERIALALMGLIYVGIFPALTVRLILESGQFQWFVFVLIAVFSGDTAAYFAGRTFGKKKVLPTISPKKTWAGCVGGLVGSFVVAGAFSLWLFPEEPTWIFALLGMAAGLMGQLGDFFESLLKRVAGVKDAGSVMPGHGGFLDRLDGVYFAGPLIYLFFTIY